MDRHGLEPGLLVQTLQRIEGAADLRDKSAKLRHAMLNSSADNQNALGEARERGKK